MNKKAKSVDYINTEKGMKQLQEKKIDRRVRKTKAIIRASLLQLMQEKGVKDISVRELSDLADINRGTFYIHYKDVFDLLEQLELELMEQLEEVMTRRSPIEMKAQPLPLLIDIYQLIADNADICKVLLGPNGDLAFVERLKKNVMHYCIEYWMAAFGTGDEKHYEYYNAFIVSGCMGLLTSWLNNGMEEGPLELAKLTERFIMEGIKVLTEG